MSVTLTQLLAKANNHLQFSDTVTYSTTEREDACRSAIKEYSLRRPNPLLQAYTGVGENPFYDLPDNWNEAFSVIYEVEYKINQTPKQVVQKKYYAIDLMSDGLKLRFGEQYPGSGETFWVKYWGNHTFDSNGNSYINDADLEGLGYLATSIMCEDLSTFFASKADPNLPNVEIVGFPDRVSQYNNRAKVWRKKYDQTIKSDMNCTWGSIDFIDNSYWYRNDE